MKEPHYFLTSSFRISKSIFEGVFRGDFFCQRVFRSYFSSYLFPRGTFKEFFPNALLPKILCSKVFLQRSYFFARGFFIDFFSNIFSLSDWMKKTTYNNYFFKILIFFYIPVNIIIKQNYPWGQSLRTLSTWTIYLTKDNKCSAKQQWRFMVLCSYLFPRGTFKEFFPKAPLPNILCSKVFLQRSYFFGVFS